MKSKVNKSLVDLIFIETKAIKSNFIEAPEIKYKDDYNVIFVALSHTHTKPSK